MLSVGRRPAAGNLSGWWLAAVTGLSPAPSGEPGPASLSRQLLCPDEDGTTTALKIILSHL